VQFVVAIGREQVERRLRDVDRTARIAGRDDARADRLREIAEPLIERFVRGGVQHHVRHRDDGEPEEQQRRREPFEQPSDERRRPRRRDDAARRQRMQRRQARGHAFGR
jgi:hypothetical protein